jgi:hypothetical protein
MSVSINRTTYDVEMEAVVGTVSHTLFVKSELWKSSRRVRQDSDGIPF